MRFVLLALALLPTVAAAQDSPAGLPSGFVTLLTGQDHRAALLQAAQGVAVNDGDACKDGRFTTTGELGFQQPLKQDARGLIVGGQWKETVVLSGCGPDRVLNALTMAQPNGTWQTVPLLPGTTIAGPQLQQDSIQYASAAMGVMPAGCQQGYVVDTRFLGVDGAPAGTKPQPSAPPLPWSETWTLQACTKRAVVGMHFMPDATGTAIRSSPAP